MSLSARGPMTAISLADTRTSETSPSLAIAAPRSRSDYSSNRLRLQGDYRSDKTP